jgi:hypothetical protein
MASSAAASPKFGDRSWSIVGHWQEYEGEGRTNLIRVAGIAAFYIVELINFYGLKLGAFTMPKVSDRPFHVAVTALAVAWTMVGLGVLLCLRGRFFPAAVKYISMGCDLVLLTALLTVANGPRSPLVAVYFVILALAALRFNTSLVQFASIGAVAGYLFVLGYAKWFSPRVITIPRDHEMIFLLSLALTGITLGQITRRARVLAQEYATQVTSVQQRER